MTIATTSESITNLQADAIIVGLSGSELQGSAAELTQATSGGLQSLLDSGQAKTKVAATTFWLQPSGVNTKVVILVGLGENPTAGDCFKAGGAAAKAIANKQISSAAFYFPELDCLKL